MLYLKNQTGGLAFQLYSENFIGRDSFRGCLSSHIIRLYNLICITLVFLDIAILKGVLAIGWIPALECQILSIPYQILGITWRPIVTIEGVSER